MLLSVVFALLAVILYGYSLLRYYHLWLRGRMPVIVYYVFQACLFGTLFIYIFFSRFLTNDIVFFVIEGIFYVHLVIMLATPFFSMIRGGIRMIGARRKKSNAFFRFFNHPSKVNYIILLLTACAGFACLINAKIVREETSRIVIDKEMQRPYVIASVSDLHIGSEMTHYEIRKMTDKLLALKADAIVFGGNVLDANANDEICQYTYNQWKRLTESTTVCFVAGEEETKWEEERFAQVRALGIRTLQDESVILQNGVQLIGCRDQSDNLKKSIKYSADLINKQKPTVVLTHQMLSQSERQQVDFDAILPAKEKNGNRFLPRKITITTLSNKRG